MALLELKINSISVWLSHVASIVTRTPAQPHVHSVPGTPGVERTFVTRALPSAGFSITIRVALPADPSAIGRLTTKVALRTRDELSRAYTPGVARVCMAIAENPDDARRLTIKRNTVAVVTDGSAVLGLGNIGPAAALPVMEGKAALFKRFGGVDAWPVVLDTQDTEEIIKIVTAIAPAYGGINLEDIAAPPGFQIQARLRGKLDIPVFHH